VISSLDFQSHFLSLALLLLFDKDPLSAANHYKKIYKTSLQQVSIEGNNHSCFRHTHCSLLFESGATIKEVQDRLGHTDVQTTMNIYAHVTQDNKEKTAKLFANYVGI
jgi:integrase